METLQTVIVQEMIESRFNRKLIDKSIREELADCPEIVQKVSEGVQIVQNYLGNTYSYQSKNIRVQALQSLDVEALVWDIYVGTAYFTKPELLSSGAAQIASRLGFSDKVDAVTTAAELLAVLSDTDMFDIFKPNASGSLFVSSRISFSEALTKSIENSRYLPPMVCKPLELTTNYSSGYITHNDGLILGNGNMHSGDICLDVLNTMNSVVLSLNTEFLCKVEEEPVFEWITPINARETIQLQTQKDQWDVFKRQSYEIYSMLVDAGNKFYLTHKYDMRGRIYSQGYHVNTEGVAQKKAMVDLYNKQVITGVPTEFQTN